MKAPRSMGGSTRATVQAGLSAYAVTILLWRKLSVRNSAESECCKVCSLLKRIWRHSCVDLLGFLDVINRSVVRFYSVRFAC
jgi:hypothetical protein